MQRENMELSGLRWLLWSVVLFLLIMAAALLFDHRVDESAQLKDAMLVCAGWAL